MAQPPNEPGQLPAITPGQTVHASTCPACGHHVAITFFDGGHLPLATLAWPASAAAAQAMRRLPHAFVRCADCGHVYNNRFDYADVPYSEKPNLMFNRGQVWAKHLDEVRDLILARLPAQPTVVEIGCGEGHLLRALALAQPDGRFIGFDPNAAVDTGDGLFEARPTLFDPVQHLAELRPDLIVSRHVMEHLTNPLGFIQSLAFAVSWNRAPTSLLIEVPCIDKVFASGRTVDFFYEHNSHFTSVSLQRMLLRCGGDVKLLERSYGDEVLFAVANFVPCAEKIALAQQATAFAHRAADAVASMRADIAKLAARGCHVAVWGGTGKAAAFINQYQLDAARFPLVVDSDPDKAGTFVPGMGQEIRSAEHLLDHPVDVIVIATQWRARDIVLEIARRGIQSESVLLEHNGRLVDYHRDPHPYGESSSSVPLAAPHWSPQPTHSLRDIRSRP